MWSRSQNILHYLGAASAALAQLITKEFAALFRIERLSRIHYLVSGFDSLKKLRANSKTETEIKHELADRYRCQSGFICSPCSQGRGLDFLF